MTAHGQVSTTPILDLEVPLPPARDQSLPQTKFVAFSALLVSAVAILIASAQNVTQEGPREWNGDLRFFLALAFLGVPLIWLALTAIHEIGHVVAGLILGFQFQALEVRPLRIEYKRGKWSVRTVGSLRLLAGGQSGMVLDRIWRVRKRLVLLYTGGLAATLPIAIGAFVIASCTTGPVPFLLAWFFGMCAVLHLAGSLVPIKSGLHWEGANDLTFLRVLLTSKQDAKRMIAGAVLQMLKNRNFDEIQWRPGWIQSAYPKAVWDEWLAYRSREVSAHLKASCLEHWLETSRHYSSEDRNGLILEAAFFMAWYRNDAAKADVWFGRAGYQNDRECYRRTRTEIALRCARGQFGPALDAWDHGLQFLQGLSQPWVRAYEHEWIEWRKEIEERRSNYDAIGLTAPPT
jgi:hypothetical protein